MIRRVALFALLLTAGCQCGDTGVATDGGKDGGAKDAGQDAGPDSGEMDAGADPDSGMPALDLSATPNPVDFGAVMYGASSTVMVTVKNHVNSPVTLDSSSNGVEFSVPITAQTIAANGTLTAMLKFTPTAMVGARNASWTLKVKGGTESFDLPLKGSVVATCIDGDSDTYGAGCAAGPDCNDMNSAIHPNALEVCNMGVDDDCNPATVESNCGCAVGACPDDPKSCLGVIGCALDAGNPVCFRQPRPDRTVCGLADAGNGLCNTAQCVECITAADCTAFNASATVCDLVECLPGGICSTTRRHDSTTWKVNPPLSAEIQVATAGAPIRANWDGQNFSIAVATSGGNFLRRVSPSGQVLDTPGLSLDPLTKDVAFSGGRYLVATLEPANGGAQTFDYVGGYNVFLDGGVGGKTAIQYDPGTSNSPANLVLPSLGGSGGNFMVASQFQAYLLVKAGVVGGGGIDVLTPYRPRYPVMTGGPLGFALTTQDLYVGGGRAEIGAAIWNAAGVGGNYVRLAQHDYPNDPDSPGTCCAGSAKMVSNGNRYLLAYAWDNGQGVYRVYDSSLQQIGPKGIFSPLSQSFLPYLPVEVATDGVNFMIVTDYTANVLRVKRIDISGAAIDPVAFEVSANDAISKSVPRLVSNGAGRNMLAYQKLEAGVQNTYVRLFTTCP